MGHFLYELEVEITLSRPVLSDCSSFKSSVNFTDSLMMDGGFWLQQSDPTNVTTIQPISKMDNGLAVDDDLTGSTIGVVIGLIMAIACVLFVVGFVLYRRLKTDTATSTMHYDNQVYRPTTISDTKTFLHKDSRAKTNSTETIEETCVPLSPLTQNEAV